MTTYGPQAPFTVSMLETLASMNLCPEDWKRLCRAVLWGRGSVCDFPQDEEVPRWIPEWLIRQISPPTDNQDDARDDSNSDPS